MIIKITQTSANIRQCYDMKEIDNGIDFHFQGKAGSLSSKEPITLTSETEVLEGLHYISDAKNYIPFRYLFGGANLTRGFDIFRNEESIGSIVFSQHGFLKSFYLISLNDDTFLRCYTVAKDSFEYVCIYKYESGREHQISLIETYLYTNDYKYTHVVYILDDYKQLADVISFFAIYYSSYNYAERFHMSKGSSYEKKFTISKYKDKYNAAWKADHFTDECFFGG